MLKGLYSFFIVVLVFIFSGSSNAQFFDNFDSYTVPGQVACQNPTDWTTWSNAPCTSEDAAVSNAFSYSSPNSALIVQNNDFIKLFGSQTTGTWYISFMAYLPTGKTGYFNAMAGFTPNPFSWGIEIYFNAAGSGAVNANGTASVATFSYPYNTWFPVQLVINLTADQVQLSVNNSSIGTWTWTAGAAGAVPLRLDAMDIFGATANDAFYIDDFWFDDQPLPVELTSFTASVTPQSQVVLNWVTATEINNRGFEVERRIVDGEYFTIGFVEGYGTTSEEKQYSYLDMSVVPGNFTYRLKQIDFNGQFEYSDEIFVEVTPPLAFGLDQNYPNPFNPNTTINYSIVEAGYVKLAIYNTLGEELKVLVNGLQEANSYTINFNASELPSGTYIYRLETAGNIETKKMILMK